MKAPPKVGRKIERYGRLPDLPDHRDFLFHRRNAVQAPSHLPLAVDLSPHCPPIYDQGQLGSCTGNGWARVLEYIANRDGDPIETPSRLFIYYNERALENTIATDSGAEVRDGAKVVASLGAPPESAWGYDISKFAEKPPQAVYDAATAHKALEYQRVVVGTPGCPMRTAVAGGYPIVFGFSVPSYFETGWDYSQPLSLPTVADEIVGGHCVVVTGYDFTCTKFAAPAFQVDNSWGPDWGLKGRFWMDFRWFDPAPGLASDLWIIKQAS